MSYRDYLRRQSLSSLAVEFAPFVNSETGELLEDSFVPAVPLSEQINSLHNGGLPLHPMGETVYDEDDTFGIDPANTYGVDRFEYQEFVQKAALKSAKKAKDLKPGSAAAPPADPAPPAPSTPQV